MADRRRRFVRKFPLGMAKPLPVPLFPYLRSGYLKKGRTIEELAAKCGIDPAGLQSTVEEFNGTPATAWTLTSAAARRAFNRYGGDAGTQPNPSLAPARERAVLRRPVVPGSFGTFAGLDCRRPLPGAG